MSTGYLKVASPELIALDLLSYPSHAGGLNHIATVLAELAESLDIKKLIKLAEQTNAGYQLQRIGYILDKIEAFDDKHRIDAIAAFVHMNRKKEYLPLAPEVSKVGYPRCKKWRIIENTEIESDL